VITEAGEERLIPRWMSDPNAFQPSSVEQPLIGLDALRHLLRVVFSSPLHQSRRDRREDVMIQLHLFPPPASPSAPLPSKACSEAKDLVASLLIAVIVANRKKRQPRGIGSHE
jgi:hypothetical protein